MALFHLDGLTIDTGSLSATGFKRSGEADFAEKATMGNLAPVEFGGEGKDLVTITGEFFPYHQGGLSEFEQADQMRRAGRSHSLARGDGKRLGSYVITKIDETHQQLSRDGIGYKVIYTLSLRKVPDDQSDLKASVQSLLNLFSSLF